MALRMHNTNTFMNYSPTWRVETLLNVIRSRKRVLSEISSSGCRCRCIKILPHSFALVTGFFTERFLQSSMLYNDGILVVEYRFKLQ